MKFPKLFIIITLFLTFTGFSYAKTCATHDEVRILVNGNNQFAFDLYKKLLTLKPQDNIFFSPFSISSALGMTYIGASGNTSSEIAKVFHFDLSDNKLNEAFYLLLKEIGEKGPGYILNIANALWGDKGYEFLSDFLNTIKTYHGGGFYEVNFRGNPEGSRIKINKWIEEKTKEKIKNLLPPESITPLTRLVITNAIYFKGKWSYPFKEENTRPMTFYAPNKKIENVPMMYQKRDFKYKEEKNFKLLELPYGDKTLSMIIILPLKKDGLPYVESNLSWDNLINIRERAKEIKVNVYIPKFKMERAYSLREPLMALGMKDAFDPKTADFSKMEPKKSLYISKIVHKAYIDVNEEGTEAAGATGVVIALKSISIKKIPEFKADHPFIYMIIHNPTGQILFMGRVIDPNI